MMLLSSASSASSPLSASSISSSSPLSLSSKKKSPNTGRLHNTSSKKFMTTTTKCSSTIIGCLLLLLFGSSSQLLLLLPVVESSTSSSSSSTSSSSSSSSSSSTTTTSPKITITKNKNNSNKNISNKKRLTEETMNINLRNMEYAVRGTVVIAADRINDELKLEAAEAEAEAEAENNKDSNNKDDSNNNSNSNSKYKFDKIIYTNIGNPQSVGQKPLTWPRQVLALIDLPDSEGINHPSAKEMFPIDAIERAKLIKEGLGGNGSGSYSHSKGIKMFREDVITFLQKRDQIDIKYYNVENIFLSNGASAAIFNLLTALIADETWYVTTV
jgi:hypothetical protein